MPSGQRRGVVRRAKLYYLRDRRGKSARIAEKRDYTLSAKKKAAPAPKKEAAPVVEEVKEEAPKAQGSEISGQVIKSDLDQWPIQLHLVPPQR